MTLFFLVILSISGIFLLVQPVWAFFDCRSSDLSSGKKTTWIIAFFIAWTLASIPYAAFVSRSKNLKLTSIIFSIPYLVFFGFLGVTIYKDPGSIEKYLTQYISNELGVVNLDNREDLQKLIENSQQQFNP